MPDDRDHWRRRGEGRGGRVRRLGPPTLWLWGADSILILLLLQLLEHLLLEAVPEPELLLVGVEYHLGVHAGAEAEVVPALLALPPAIESNPCEVRPGFISDPALSYLVLAVTLHAPLFLQEKLGVLVAWCARRKKARQLQEYVGISRLGTFPKRFVHEIGNGASGRPRLYGSRKQANIGSIFYDGH